jgi:hypothetical protein
MLSGPGVFQIRIVPISMRRRKSIVLMTKKLKKYLAVKKIYIFFSSKHSIYLSLGLHKGYPSYWRLEKPSALKKEHPALPGPLINVKRQKVELRKE